MSVIEGETQVKPFETCSFLSGHVNYVLHRPIQCLSARQDGLWVFECPQYGLVAFSADHREAKEQLEEEFGILYEGLIHQPDEALTQDAIRMRDKLRADVKTIQPLA